MNSSVKNATGANVTGANNSAAYQLKVDALKKDLSALKVNIDALEAKGKNASRNNWRPVEAKETDLEQRFFSLRREAREQNDATAVSALEEMVESIMGHLPQDPNDYDYDPNAEVEAYYSRPPPHNPQASRYYNAFAHMPNPPNYQPNRAFGGSTIIPQPLNHKPHPPALPVPAVMPSPPGTHVVAVPAFASIRLGPTVLPPPSPNRAAPSIINTPPGRFPPTFSGGSKSKASRKSKKGGACCGQRIGGARKVVSSRKSKASRRNVVNSRKASRK